MVDERALEHLVHLAQVVLVGHPVAGAPDQPEHARRPAPSASGVVDQVRLVGRDRPAHLPPGADLARSRRRPASGAAARRRRRRRCRSAARRARGRRRPPAPGRRPTRPAGRSSASATSSGRSRSTTWTKSIRPLGAVVDAAPGPDRRRPRRGRRRSPASAARARRPRRARRRRRRAGPAPAVPLVGAQQVGQPGDVERGRRGPACRPPSPSGSPGGVDQDARRGRSRTGCPRGSRSLILPLPGRGDRPPRIRPTETLRDRGQTQARLGAAARLGGVPGRR